MAPGAHIVSVVLEPQPQSARLARDIVLDAFPESQVRDSIELIASELVTNAIVHGIGPITFSLEDHRESVTISVSNEISESPISLTATMPGIDSETGRGLALVELLSQSWSYSVENSVLTVSAIVAK